MTIKIVKLINVLIKRKTQFTSIIVGKNLSSNIKEIEDKMWYLQNKLQVFLRLFKCSLA